MNLQRTSRALWILLTSVLLGCAATPSIGEPTKNAAKRKRLPPEARPLLTDRMYVHGEDLSDLNWAVIFLDRASVQEIAERISEAPRFAPPTSEDATELNARIPEEFLGLQLQLAERARQLRAAAESSDLVQVSTAYGQLVETCVRCHDQYLEEPPARAVPEQER